MKTASVFALLPLLVGMLHAAPRTSTNYSIIADSDDGGGQRTASVNYTNDGSMGGVTGNSTVTAPAETAKSGYLSQLYEVTAVQVTATPTTVNEGGTRQLVATASL